MVSPPPHSVGTDKSSHLQLSQTWSCRDSGAFPKPLTERDVLRTPCTASSRQVPGSRGLRVPPGSHWGPTGTEATLLHCCQAGILWAWGVLQEPNSTVNESLVPEPFKTRCFLVLRRCQQRPVLLETKRKPCLHISPVSSDSFGRKTALLSSHQIHPIVACPFWWCQHFKHLLHPLKNLHEGGE